MRNITKYLDKTYLPAMIGSAIEWYDIALYWYLAPILIKVFLPTIPSTKAYFFYFLFEFIAGLCQIVGSRILGKIGDQRGRRTAIYYSILGTSIATFTIAIMPTYQNIGALAAILFFTCRMIQSFFLGGEYTGGAIFCLEHTEEKKDYGLVIGLYSATTVFGIIGAATMAIMINRIGPEYFRLGYALSFIFALVTFNIRKNIKETPQYLENKNRKNEIKLINQLKTNPDFRYKFLAIIASSLFFGMLYSLPGKIFNVILPMASKISLDHIMIINNIFLFYYMGLLFFFGYISDNFAARKIMKYAIGATVICTYPAIMLIQTNTLLGIITAKAIFATLAAGFIGPFHIWAYSLFSVKLRYSNIGTADAIGKSLCQISLAGSILIFEHFKSLVPIGLILIITALCAYYTLLVIYSIESSSSSS